jgi:hypothetical protein
MIMEETYLSSTGFELHPEDRLEPMELHNFSLRPGTSSSACQGKAEGEGHNTHCGRIRVVHDRKKRYRTSVIPELVASPQRTPFKIS